MRILQGCLCGSFGKEKKKRKKRKKGKIPGFYSLFYARLDFFDSLPKVLKWIESERYGWSIQGGLHVHQFHSATDSPTQAKISNATNQTTILLLLAKTMRNVPQPPCIILPT